MKTKISLSIVGVFNILMSLIMAFAIKSMAPTMLNSDSQETIRMVEVMHYGLFPAILIVGLICLLCRNAPVRDCKKNTTILFNRNIYFNVYVFCSICE